MPRGLADMEGAPVTAATGTLGPVIAMLAALLGRGYKLRRGTRTDLNIIRSKLKSIHSILWIIWESQEDLDAASKELKMEALYLADDMDDAIDDFILTMESPKKINGRSIQPTTTPFQDLKRRAIDLSKQFRNRWKTKATCSLFSRKNATFTSSTGKPKPRAPFVLADKSQLVGMDVPKDRLIKHLVGEEESAPVQRQIKMASIVGTAGMGKTTLARLVYQEIENNFQARAFVSVNPGGDIKEVLASILQQLGAVLPTGAIGEKRLINTISKFLKEKRYVVMIDDIWHGREWETIKRSLPPNNMGSTIVTTTRINAIAEKWRGDFDTLIYKMDNKWDGLRERWVYSIGGEDVAAGMVAKPGMVGEGFDCDHPIVHMCDGMPLALYCMFSAMAKEQEYQEQQGNRVETRDVQGMIEKKIKQKGIHNTPGFEPLVESLLLGYIHLPHHMLKTCLLYCSIYPEGQEIGRDHLVRRWLAERFVHTEETAKGYFDELVNRGLILPLQDKTWSTYIYRLHPMMQNFLRYILREDNFITCSSDIPASYAGRIRLLYIDDGPVVGVDPISEIDLSHIRSLVVSGGAKGVKRVHLGQLERLRVFDLHPVDGDINHLENDHLKEICGLLRLRHLLGLRGMGIGEIPPKIGRLHHLETLELSRTGITKLPSEIGNLQHLKNLDLEFNHRMNEVPREIGELQNLEYVCLGSTFITELPCEIIGRLLKLKSLDVSWNQHMTKLPSEIWKLQHLRTLNLSVTGIEELPPEVGNLQNLEALNLGGLSTMTKLPREIGKLQNLEALDLKYTSVTKLPREIEGLKKLKTIRGVHALPWEAGQLTQLMGLPECVRHVWKKSHVVSSLAEEILSLHLPDGSGDAGLTVGTKKMRIPRWIKDHFNDLAFLDIRICKLEQDDLKFLREMPNLQSLALRFEVVPRKPVTISGEGFAVLEILRIDSRVPRVTFEEGAMPRLQSLWVTFQFYAGSPNYDPVGINHLTSLKNVDIRCKGEWYQLDSPCISATIGVLKKEIREHRNDVKLVVSGGPDCPGFEVYQPNKNREVVSEEINDASSIGMADREEESSRVVEEGISSGTDCSIGTGEIEEESSQA